jgi:hypothetical protein
MKHGLTLPSPAPNYYLSSLASWLGDIDIVPNVTPPGIPDVICRFLLPLLPELRQFPLHAAFTDGSLIHSRNTVDSLFTSTNYSKKCTAKGVVAALVLLGSPSHWKTLAPIVIRIKVNALEFPGITAYVMEVLALSE